MIAYELEYENDSPFAGQVEIDESYFGGHRKANVGGALPGKCRYSGF